MQLSAVDIDSGVDRRLRLAVVGVGINLAFGSRDGSGVDRRLRRELRLPQRGRLGIGRDGSGVDRRLRRRGFCRPVATAAGSIEDSDTRLTNAHSKKLEVMTTAGSIEDSDGMSCQWPGTTWRVATVAESIEDSDRSQWRARRRRDWVVTGPLTGMQTVQRVATAAESIEDSDVSAGVSCVDTATMSRRPTVSCARRPPRGRDGSGVDRRLRLPPGRATAPAVPSRRQRSRSRTPTYRVRRRCVATTAESIDDFDTSGAGR
jgi:hypothetical protein